MTVAEGGALVQEPVLQLAVASGLEKERLDGVRVSGGSCGKENSSKAPNALVDVEADFRVRRRRRVASSA